MKVSALSVDPISSLPVVLLIDDECRMLPITIGLGEVSAVAAELGCIELERPNTHRLMAALMERTGAIVDRVEIHDVSDGMLHARIHLVLATGEAVVEDSRPSDALVLALLTSAEIRVAGKVLALVGHDATSPSQGVSWPLAQPEKPELELSEFSDEAFGKWKM